MGYPWDVSHIVTMAAMVITLRPYPGDMWQKSLTHRELIIARDPTESDTIIDQQRKLLLLGMLEGELDVLLIQTASQFCLHFVWTKMRSQPHKK